MREDAATTAFDELVAQLRSEVGAIVSGLTALLGPGEQTELLQQRVDSRAVMWASDLLGEDDNLAAETVITLASVLWPHGGEPSVQWWKTPLGRAVARSVGHPTADVVSGSVAGAMLGCTRQNVSKMIHYGHLTAGPAGGVTVESIRAYLRQNGPTTPNPNGTTTG